MNKLQRTLMGHWIRATVHQLNDMPGLHEDLVQEGWVIAIQAYNDYDPGYDMSLKSWVISKLRRDLSRYLTSERKHLHGHDDIEEFLDLDDCDELTDYEQQIRMEMLSDCVDLVDMLSEREANVVELLYFQDLSEREAGELLGVSRSMIRKIHDRAVAKLQQLVG